MTVSLTERSTVKLTVRQSFRQGVRHDKKGFILMKRTLFLSFFKRLVKGVYKASRQKVTVGGKSANERGDGRAYDPTYV